jgi:hypothetical protein
MQAERYAARGDVKEVYLGKAAKDKFHSPKNEKFPDVVAIKNDGTTAALGEGKGTDMPKLVKQFEAGGARLKGQGYTVTEQEVVVPKLDQLPEGGLSPGPGGRINQNGYLEVFDERAGLEGSWVEARPNGVPIKVIVKGP